MELMRFAWNWIRFQEDELGQLLTKLAGCPVWTGPVQTTGDPKGLVRLGAAKGPPVQGLFPLYFGGHPLDIRATPWYFLGSIRT